MPGLKDIIAPPLPKPPERWDRLVFESTLPRNMESFDLQHRMHSPDLAANTIKLVDYRPSATNKGNFTRNYPLEVLLDVAIAARNNNIDPQTALAMAIAEGAEPLNPMRLVNANITTRSDVLDKSMKHLLERMSTVPVDAAEALKIQAYNGLGKLGAGYYGLNRQIDAAREMPYGKRVLDIREHMVKRNPIVDAILRWSK